MSDSGFAGRPRLLGVTMFWSYCVMDARGVVLDEVDADRVHETASLGKVFLLCEAAEHFIDGSLDSARVVQRDREGQVADSGLWQHLSQGSLPIVDICVLVAAVSDNWATNTLLREVGLPAVADRGRELGCAHSGLHDRVRDVRRAGDPPALSTGTAREMAEVARRIRAAASGDDSCGISPAAAAMVEGWLLTGVDLSMVGAPFSLDPLAHVGSPVRLWCKTGRDERIRADMGAAWSDRDSLAFAAMATWDHADDVGDQPISLMHALGSGLAARMNEFRQVS